GRNPRSAASDCAARCIRAAWHARADSKPRLSPATTARTARSPNARRRACHRRRTRSRVAATEIPPGNVGDDPSILARVQPPHAAVGMVACAEGSVLGALYVLWAALLVWLGAHLREHCGIERVGLVLQGFVAFGGFLVAITGFILYYQIDWAGFRLISGAGMDGMYGSIAQRNNFANYLGCALASVVFLFGRRRLSLPLATLLAAP